jgi:hypothetical protein
MKTQTLFFATILLTACGGNPETEITEPTKTDTTAAIQDEPEASIYEKDWRNFKIAIADKDEPAIGYFLDTDAIDVAELLRLFSDEAFAQILENTNYDGLVDSEWETRPVKEFRADSGFTDEDGNTYESAIFLYFEEQDQGLKLVNFLMAG